MRSFIGACFVMFLLGCDSSEEKQVSSAVASSQKETKTEKEDQFSQKDPEIEPNVIVAGNVKDGFKASIVIEANTSNGSLRIAHGFTDDKGNFSIAGAIEAMGLYQLRLEEKLARGQEPKVVPMTLVPGDSVFIQLDFNTFNQTPVYSNTSWAPVLNGYMTEMKKFITWQRSIQNPQQYDNETLMKMVKKEKKSMDDFSIKSVKKDPANPANILLMTNLLPMMGYEHWDEGHLKALKMIQTGFENAYPDHPMTNNITKQITQAELDYKEYLDFTVNNKAPEIVMQDPQGGIRKLSDLRGKYVLIDFWASWCGPCRVENPNVVRVYNQYKNKNFDIFSVSLDNDKNKWKQAIDADGLIWRNHVSDLKGWQSDVVSQYGFRGIPHTVLIDPEGKIVASNLRGPSLEQKLKELLK